MPLPIEPLLPEIVGCLVHGSRVVLRAPPGAGKTTRVPPTLLDAKLAGGKQVVVLEPRRLAARAAAEYVAAGRGSGVGREVGYRVRFEQKGNEETRLWFLTEGVFSRQLARDPFLEDVGIVVLDEFHERHLQGDIALGVVRELQGTVRPDLRLVVMSATLETERDGRVARGRGDASASGPRPIITRGASGRFRKSCASIFPARRSSSERGASEICGRSHGSILRAKGLSSPRSDCSPTSVRSIPNEES